MLSNSDMPEDLAFYDLSHNLPANFTFFPALSSSHVLTAVRHLIRSVNCLSSCTDLHLLSTLRFFRTILIVLTLACVSVFCLSSIIFSIFPSEFYKRSSCICYVHTTIIFLTSTSTTVILRHVHYQAASLLATLSVTWTHG